MLGNEYKEKSPYQRYVDFVGGMKDTIEHQGSAFERLFFLLLEHHPHEFSLKLTSFPHSSNQLTFERSEIREFDQTPPKLNKSLSPNLLIIHKPKKPNYPNIDGMLEFLVEDGETTEDEDDHTLRRDGSKLYKKHLIFFQITIDTPEDHTKVGNRILFFENEYNDIQAMLGKSERFSTKHLQEETQSINSHNKESKSEDEIKYMAKLNILTNKYKNELENGEYKENFNLMREEYQKSFLWVLIPQGRFEFQILESLRGVNLNLRGLGLNQNLSLITKIRNDLPSYFYSSSIKQKVFTPRDHIEEEEEEEEEKQNL